MAYSLKVKYTAHNSKVTGSIPVKPRIKVLWKNSSIGRVLACQAKSCEFESHFFRLL